jgi:hypothetical protein
VSLSSVSTPITDLNLARLNGERLLVVFESPTAHSTSTTRSREVVADSEKTLGLEAGRVLGTPVQHIRNVAELQVEVV